jgi:hypothetical protein
MRPFFGGILSVCHYVSNTVSQLYLAAWAAACAVTINLRILVAKLSKFKTGGHTIFSELFEDIMDMIFDGIK